MSITDWLIVFSIPSAGVGLLIWWFKRYLDRNEKRQSERDSAHKRYEMLLIDGIDVSISLGKATATALKNGKCNGETSVALKKAVEFECKQKDFFSEQTIEHM